MTNKAVTRIYFRGCFGWRQQLHKGPRCAAWFLGTGSESPPLPLPFGGVL